MIEAYLNRFLMGRQFLWQARLRIQAEARAHPQDKVPESLRPQLERDLQNGMKETVILLRLDRIQPNCVRLENLLNNYTFQPYTWANLNDLVNRVWDDIELEIQGEYFFRYPRDMAFQRLRIDHDWKSSLAAFPSAKKEIEAGIDCRALGDFAGSIFHMIRAAEIALRCLAKERGIKRVKKRTPIDYGTWGEIIAAIETESDKIRSTVAAGPKKEAALTFYHSAASDLRALLKLFRDPTMHLRDEYDFGNADSAIFRTKSLLEMLAPRLNEMQPKCIRWGFR
jgi:hypothetical protein